MPLDTLHLDVAPVQYATAGPEHGPVVVLVHGALVDHTVWGQVPQLLAQAGCRVICPILPLGSHSMPAAVGTDLSPRGLAGLLTQFLDRLDLHEVTLVGNDTGGMICQFLLDAETGKPARVSRLLLTNCDAFDRCPPFPFNLQFQLFRKPALGAMVAAALRISNIRNSPIAYGLLSASLTPELTEGWIAPYQRHPAVRRDAATFMRAIDAAEVDRVSSQLSRCIIPVRICWGMADRCFTPTLGRRIAAAANNAPFIEIDGARTFVALDQPVRLARHLLTFIGVHRDESIPAEAVDAP